MTYLVTGGAGFIGSHLVEALLKKGHSVINIDNFDSFYDYRVKVNNTLASIGLKRNFKFEGREKDLENLVQYSTSDTYTLFIADIRDHEKLKEIFSTQPIDAVIHLAALAGVRPSIERPGEYVDVNIRGTQNIFEICKEFGVSNIISASSSSVYGNNEKVPFAENDVVDYPISPYAATKKATELLGHVYFNLYRINQIHLRFFTVYGPRQRPDLAIHKFTELISKGEAIPYFGDGNTSRDYTYITDIVEGILSAIDYLQKSESIYEILNLGGDKVVSLDEMICEIERNLGKKALKDQRDPQPGDVVQTWADLSLSAKILGYRPKTSFQNGIKNFVEWFLRKEI